MNQKKKIVLVIDDQEKTRRLVEVSLRGKDFEVFKASSGPEGIKVAKSILPHIILLDIMMPHVDGIATCKLLKRDPVTKNIPVIFLTGKSSPDVVKLAIEAGGIDYVVKPFSPDGLMKRIQKWQTEQTEEKAAADVLHKAEGDLESESKSMLSFAKAGDVMALSTTLESIEMDNFLIYRDIFANIIDDGIYKVAFDIDNIRKMDGAGLGLLISVDNALRNRGGELRITYPIKELINQFSFTTINYLFNAYKNIEEAIESFQEKVTEGEEQESFKDLNVCLACTFVNPPKLRYCGYCGANLLIGKGEKILDRLMDLISKKIVSDAMTKNIQEINKLRQLNIKEKKINSVLEVELFLDDVVIKYKSNNTDDTRYEENEEISIQAPIVNGHMLPVQPGNKLLIKAMAIGKQSKFETEIRSVDKKRNMIVVHYTEEAKNLHEQDYFSLNPKLPIPVKLMNPSLPGKGEIYNGIILELSRMGIVIFTKDNLPVDKCLALRFSLNGKRNIKTPIAVAREGERKFLFNLEFVVIDERERTEIVQYMYKRQIEIKKGKH